jgi:hypothetical protein
MKPFRFSLIVLWLLIAALTMRAIVQLGPLASWVFVTDFQHPWRAMLNSDFVFHLLLVGLWVLYRERSLAVGIPCALLAAAGGMPFTLLYLLLTTYRERGDMRRVLLGGHFPG